MGAAESDTPWEIGLKKILKKLRLTTVLPNQGAPSICCGILLLAGLNTCTAVPTYSDVEQCSSRLDGPRRIHP